MALGDAWDFLKEDSWCPDCAGSGYSVDGGPCDCGIAPKRPRPPVTPTDETSAAANENRWPRPPNLDGLSAAGSGPNGSITPEDLIAAQKAREAAAGARKVAASAREAAARARKVAAEARKASSQGNETFHDPKFAHLWCKNRFSDGATADDYHAASCVNRRSPGSDFCRSCLSEAGNQDNKTGQDDR